jgi:hypothetical protein
VQDLAAELNYFPPLSALAQFHSLIVRFGAVGAAYVPRDGHPHLVFAPLAKDGVYRERHNDGQIIGSNFLLCAAIIRSLLASGTNLPPDRDCKEIVLPALARGLLAGMAVYDRGYKAFEGDNGEKFLENFFKAAEPAICGQQLENIDRQQTIGSIAIPHHIWHRPGTDAFSRRPTWQILSDQLNWRKKFSARSEKAKKRKNALVSRINLGTAIALYGPDNVLNRHFMEGSPLPTAQQDLLYCPKLDNRLAASIVETLRTGQCVVSAEETADHVTLPTRQLPLMPEAEILKSTPHEYDASPIVVPVMRFGKLLSVERPDIETLRSIHNLIRNYVEQELTPGAQPTPVSVAVFGAPGAGKSFAVKQIAHSIDPASKVLEIVEYNVAQFRNIDDLNEAVLRLTSIRAQGKIPLAFFDEFDCEHDGAPLGWLKYFLAPMQDGIFYGARQTIRFGRAVLVFAGGTSKRFAHFDPTSGRRYRTGSGTGAEGRERRIDAFKAQKGPDFVSRLRGHLDIPPINSRIVRTKHIIRRAIVLRSLLEAQCRTRKTFNCEIAHINVHVLYALLTVDRYRHGTRSMEAILQMCRPMSGKIEVASLPSHAQLNMHVNADEFFIRIYRGRARQQSRFSEENAIPPSPPAPAAPPSGNAVDAAPQVPFDAGQSRDLSPPGADSSRQDDEEDNLPDSDGEEDNPPGSSEDVP